MQHLIRKIVLLALVAVNYVLTPFFPATAQQLSRDTPSAMQPPEPLYVSFDKPFYAVGETIWFSVFFINPKTVQSSVVYVDMLNPAGEVVMQQKLKADSVGAYSEFTIPFSWSEGYFRFRAYTLWNLNFDESWIFTKDIPIYSEWQATLTLPEYDTNPKTDVPATTNRGSLKINIQPGQPTYQKGEKVTVNISVTDANNQPVQAHLSLSVTDMDLIPSLDSMDIVTYQSEFIQTSSIHQPSQLTYMPEKSLTLSGTLTEANSNTPLNTRFLSVYLAKNRNFLNTEITRGELFIKLPDFYGSQTIQIHNHNPYQSASPQVTITNIAELLPSEIMTKITPPRTPAIEQYLYLSSMRRKLNEIFGLAEENTMTPMQDTVSFLADKTYWMKDYQLLKNMEDFIREVIFRSRIREGDEGKTVRLYNMETQRYFEDAPWYVVNGYLVTDEALVLTIPANNIEKAAFFYRRNTIVQQFPPMMLRSGVLAIDTKENKIFPSLLNASNNFTCDGFYLPKAFDKPSEKSEQTPDFRPLVFWHPQISTDQKGNASLTFTATDAISRFLIHAEGVSAQGKAGVAQAIYQVTF